MSPKSNGQFDYWLLIAVLSLSGLGLIMVFSSSAILAQQIFHDKLYFFKKQILFFLLGLIVMWIVYKLPAKLWVKYKYLFLLLTIICLGLTVFSPLGKEVGGARRWLKMLYFSFQPLEMAKLVLVFYLAYFYANKQDKIKNFGIGIFPPLIVTLILCSFLVLQPDLGGTVFLLMIFFSMAFVSGVPISKLFGLAFAGLIALSGFILSASYRIKRVEAFLHPFADPHNKGYQLVQSLYGLANGSLFGVGLGEGKQKFFYLPEAHNDFILSILGEEMGFIGLSLVFLAILIILLRWFKIVLQQQDLECKLLAFGTGLILLLGMFLNIAVVIGAIPPKGISMPFVSYGGSNLLISFFCAGILLNLAKNRS
ncbi:MAG: putative lipid II flippase FtsW [Desulfonauticus sp.]|nr:putative lipid II flippase FtsW [Desulfonauticus sp.]